MLPQENFESLVLRDAIQEHFQGEVSCELTISVLN